MILGGERHDTWGGEAVTEQAQESELVNLMIVKLKNNDDWQVQEHSWVVRYGGLRG